MSDLHQLRLRLQGALTSDADLNAFCREFFPDVHRRFTDGMDRLAKLTLLLTLADPAEIETSLAKYTASQRSPSPPPPAPPPAPPKAGAADSSPPPPASELDWRNPLSVLKAAIAAVPVMKYALGVAGLGAVVATVTRGFGLDAETATLGSLAVLALMTVLIVLAVAARQSQQLARQSQVLTWAFVLLTLSASALLLASLFFHWPRPLRCLVHDERCEKPAQSPAPPLPTTTAPTATPPAAAPAKVELITLPIDSTPGGAKVWSADNAALCEKTPCAIQVPAHAPLELRFDYPGRHYTFKTADPTVELSRGGVRVTIPPSKVP